MREARELVLGLAEDNIIDAIVPRYECQICLRHLITNKLLPRRQPPVQHLQHPRHPPQLVVVPLYG